jgi:hypothetical protein
MTGRSTFIWHARVKPLGLPLAGLVAKRLLDRGRSTGTAAAAALIVTGIVAVAADVEFRWRRAQWRASRDDEA